jgi:hypothetical protein
MCAAAGNPPIQNTLRCASLERLMSACKNFAKRNGKNWSFWRKWRQNANCRKYH